MTLNVLPTQSQSDAPQVAMPEPADRANPANPPSGTNVPSGFAFVETAYEPNGDVTKQEVAKLSDNDFLTGLKKQRKRSFGEMHAYIIFLDEATARFSDEQPRAEGGQFQRGSIPTLPEAFAAVGLNYETERKRKQRYLAAMNVRLATQTPPQLAEGDTVKLKDDTKNAEYVVMNLHESAPKVDIAPKGNEDGETLTVLAESLKKVTTPVKKVKKGDLILCEDTGAELVYEGQGKFTRTATPTLLEQKRERELASLKAKQERAKAKAEEKQRQKELRNAEDTRRDLDKLAETKRSRQRGKKAAADTLTKRSAKAKTFVTKRLENPIDDYIFGTFNIDDLNNPLSKAKKLEDAEAETRRLNTKYAGKAEPLEMPPGVLGAQVQQTAVSVM